MTINLSVPTSSETPHLKPRITVIGVGGAGGNAVNNMIESQLEGVEFMVANTDAQALAQSRADQCIQLGINVTQGLGAGSRPDIGRAAAEESLEEVLERIDGANMIFLAAGMGGGTGTGAAPVIARAARENGILTVGVVTKPFQFEGQHRMRLADAGIEALEQFVDTLIIIPNQNLFRIANEKTTFADAFNMADQVLHSGVRGVTDLMVMPGLINLDFADIRSVMSEMGKAMMGTGEAEGERRALDAAEAAISNPLLDDTSMKGAKGVLINITGGLDMTLFEVDEAANRIRAEVDSDAYIIFGSTFDEHLEGRMRVSVVATGMAGEEAERTSPVMLDVIDAHGAPLAAEPEGADISTVVEINQGSPAQSPAEPLHAPAPAPAAVMRAEPVVGRTAATDIPHAPRRPAAPRVMATPLANTGDAYIPPPPVTAAAAAAAEPRPADPYAAAAMANGAREPVRQTEPAASPVARERGPSLFERVIGAGRASRGHQATGQAQARAEPIADSVAPPAPRAESRHGAVDAPDPAPTPESEEDLLDIPAFLRRQAN